MLRGIQDHEIATKNYVGCVMKTRDEWEKAAAGLSVDGRAVINGARVATEKTSEDISPVTAKSLADVSECGQREVDQAVASSRAAFENGWSQMSPGARKGALHKLAELILANADELA
jgi:delta 1-pyrroline-5-carboxylate dehydrogenase